MEIDNTNWSLINKKRIFGDVEKLFRDHISNYPEYEQHAIICCDEELEDALIPLADRIKLNVPYNVLSDKNLYLVLIMIYYSLLGEPNSDVFTINFLDRYTAIEDRALVKDLYLKLTTGKIIEPSGRNLSRDVRRGFLGFKPIGGKIKKKSYKNKTTNKRKSHKKRRKTRKYLNKKNKKLN